MTGRSIALPMYLGAPEAVQTLWDALRPTLAAAGLSGLPSLVDWPQDLHRHWLAPELLLSQSCGYPLTHALRGRVQVLGCFAYSAPQCKAGQCASVLVARQEHGHLAPRAFAGLRAAYNSVDSQSGYNALRALVAPWAQQGRFFGQVLATGGHRLSVDAVREGRADVAAVDCVTWALLQRYAPQAVQGLCVVGQTGSYPGLPLITSCDTPAAEVRALRSALQALFAQPEAKQALAALAIIGFEALDAAAYAPCVEMENSAIALGYPQLA